MEFRKPMTLGRKWLLDLGAVMGGFLALAALQLLMQGMGLMGFWPNAVRLALVCIPVGWFLSQTNAAYKKYKISRGEPSRPSDDADARPTAN